MARFIVYAITILASLHFAVAKGAWLGGFIIGIAVGADFITEVYIRRHW